jgi:hypothetical protein
MLERWRKEYVIVKSGYRRYVKVVCCRTFLFCVEADPLRLLTMVVYYSGELTEASLNEKLPSNELENPLIIIND